MLRIVTKQAIEEIVEHNAEPFIDETGINAVFLDSASQHTGSTFAVEGEGDYIIDDEYGRVWSREFFGRARQVYGGPQVYEGFSNYGFLAVPFRQVPRRRVETRHELYGALRALYDIAKERYSDRVIVWRGQAKEHQVVRPHHERELLFGSSDIVEPSVRPSGTRRAPLSDTAQAVWSILVQRHLARVTSYDPAHRAMETQKAWPYATHLGPFLSLAFAQHYGLPTPALDVTTDIGVALWFALNTLTNAGDGNTVPAGAAGGEGVVYCIASEKGQYFGKDLKDLVALRPQRQYGGFLASNWGNSKNRVARYIIGAVYFPHEIAREITSELPTAEYLFPGPYEDKFVAMLQEVAMYRRHRSAALAAIAEHIYWVERQRAPTQTSGTDSGGADGVVGNPDEDYLAGRICFMKGDYENAELLIQRAAARGHLAAMTWLGTLLSDRGDPVGERWTRRAAEAGQPDAMNNLGLSSEKRGEDAEAERWFLRAARLNNVTAAYNLGSLFYRTGRRNDAKEWLAIASEAGDPDAACNLGKLFYDDNDLQAAEKWFRVGAEAGQAQAAHNLGHLCKRDGRKEEAIHWFRRATDLGDPDAHYYLGQLTEQQ